MNPMMVAVEAATKTTSIQWASLSPVLALVTGGLLMVLVETFVKGKGIARWVIEVILAVGTLALSAALVAWRWTIITSGGLKPGTQVARGEYFEDPASLAFGAIILLVGLLSVLVVADRARAADGSFTPQAADSPGSPQESYALKVGYQRTEVFVLLVFSVAGMMVFASTTSLLVLFVALEVMSLPLYVMAATARRRRLLSQEAGFKYFLLGAFASAFFLLGVAMLNGYSGTLDITKVSIAAEKMPGGDLMLLAGTVLVLVGLLFKVGAVPFHAWTPDVYHGAPSPITGFMAAGVKVAAFGALIRVAATLGLSLAWDLLVLLVIVSIATMLVGTFTGIVQTDIKRMLAYSSIAHAGFILIGILAVGAGATSSIMFYLLTYALASVGAFALVSLVREKSASGDILGEATSLDRWRGLGRKNPVMGMSMLIFLMSFAGIPLTGGFIGKFVVFADGVRVGLIALVAVAIFASAITAYFYFRVVLVMFFEEPDERGAIEPGDNLAKGVVIFSALATILLGVAPMPVIHFLQMAAATVVS